MSTPDDLLGKSRLAVLPEHFATIDDPRDVRRITHALAEILPLGICGGIPHRAAGVEPIHLVSAFAAASRLMLGQEAMPTNATIAKAIQDAERAGKAARGQGGSNIVHTAPATRPSTTTSPVRARASGHDHRLEPRLP